MSDSHFVPADHPRGQSAIITLPATYSDTGLSEKSTGNPLENQARQREPAKACKVEKPLPKANPRRAPVPAPSIKIGTSNLASQTVDSPYRCN